MLHLDVSVGRDVGMPKADEQHHTRRLQLASVPHSERVSRGALLWRALRAKWRAQRKKKPIEVD